MTTRPATRTPSKSSRSVLERESISTHHPGYSSAGSRLRKHQRVARSWRSILPPSAPDGGASPSPRPTPPDGLPGAPDADGVPPPRPCRDPFVDRHPLDSGQRDGDLRGLAHDDGTAGTLGGVQLPGPPAAPRRLVVRTPDAGRLR